MQNCNQSVFLKYSALELFKIAEFLFCNHMFSYHFATYVFRIDLIYGKILIVRKCQKILQKMTNTVCNDKEVFLFK